MIHYIDLIRIYDFFHIMGDENHRNFLLLSQLLHCLKDFLAAYRIQHGSRLIQHDALRLHGYHAGNRHPLLLSP